MKEISIRELHGNTAQWVKHAVRRESIIITDDGQPVATLSAFESAPLPKGLPDREDRIRRRSLISVDSADYISEMRD